MITYEHGKLQAMCEITLAIAHIGPATLAYKI